MPFHLPRIQLPADFKPSRLIPLGFAIAFLLSAYLAASRLPGYGGIIIAMGCITGAGVCLGVGSAGIVSSPFGGLVARLFFPEETLTRPPEDLLRNLRMRLRDRHWDSVDQQTIALIRAYGPSPRLYHLRALLTAGRDGSHSAITIEASTKLSTRDFDLYNALLRRDPPPAAPQTGIEA